MKISDKMEKMSCFILAPVAPGELKFIVGENTIADSLTIILWDLAFSISISEAFPVSTPSG